MILEEIIKEVSIYKLCGGPYQLEVLQEDLTKMILISEMNIEIGSHKANFIQLNDKVNQLMLYIPISVKEHKGAIHDFVGFKSIMST
jgi:hypothetical protein